MPPCRMVVASLPIVAMGSSQPERYTMTTFLARLLLAHAATAAGLVIATVTAAPAHHRVRSGTRCGVRM